ncbi:MAG: extracellular solute-binding protein [Spirochaetes bacterium]|nr:extracellular solute-binding protein [Spirochaetota bacterium]
MVALLLLAAALFTASLGATGKKEEGPKAPAGVAPAAVAPAAAASTGGGALTLPVVPAVLEITVWKQNHGKVDYTDNMEMWNRAAERTNIRVRFKTIPAGTAEDVKRGLALEVAAGANLDVYCGDKADLNEHGEAGAFLDLEPLVRQYAPTIKKYLLDDRGARELVVSNSGKMFVVAQMAAIKAKTGFLVRKDWMDKLKQKVPVTPDDWVAMLRAFRDGDPNGNGRADEIPFFVRTVLDDIWSWGTAFNAETYRENEWALRDGKFIYGATEPQFKEFLVFVHGLYKDRLLDQEYLTRPATFRDDAIKNNIGGSTHDWFASTYTRVDKYKKDVPGLALLGVAPPSIPGRSKPYTRIQMETVREQAWAISVKNKHPVETIKFMEYVFSDEGMMLFNFGIPEKHYNPANNQYTDLILKYPDGLSEAINKLGSGNFPYRQHPDYERQFGTAEAYTARALYESLILPVFPPMRFPEKDALRVADLRESCRTYRDEMVNKFIVGTEPLEKFDAFVAQLRKIGAAELETLYADAYKRYLAQK